MAKLDKDPIKSLEIEIRLLEENIKFYSIHRRNVELIRYYSDLLDKKQKELKELKKVSV
jgi:hypothetical protein